MLRLFGAPSERVFAAYAEGGPLADGWEERVGLYQLLPLLVHAAAVRRLLPGRGRTRGARYAAEDRLAVPRGASRAGERVGEGMCTPTLAARRRLYLLSRVIVARHYRRQLTLAAVARALSSSPRQLQRAYAQFGERASARICSPRRMAAGAQLLLEQPAIAVRDVARLVGSARRRTSRARSAAATACRRHASARRRERTRRPPNQRPR